MNLFLFNFSFNFLLNLYICSEIYLIQSTKCIICIIDADIFELKLLKKLQTDISDKNFLILANIFLQLYFKMEILWKGRKNFYLDYIDLFHLLSLLNQWHSILMTYHTEEMDGEWVMITYSLEEADRLEMERERKFSVKKLLRRIVNYIQRFLKMSVNVFECKN